MSNLSDSELDTLRVELLSDLMAFTQFFFKIRTNRDFRISSPLSRKSHHIAIVEHFEKVIDHELHRLIIQIAPRYGKTELAINFVAWALANYPDSKFLYVSYSLKLAAKQTQTIREIVSHPLYQKLFGVQIKDSSRAKDNFETTRGGGIYAAGEGGTITGWGAGIEGTDRFGGCIVIDDIHKPSEVCSDTIREGTNDWYLSTLYSRVNDPKTPIIFVGQGLHEDDLSMRLRNGFDGDHWDTLILKSLDVNENALFPEKHTKEDLIKMREIMPYHFSAQHQHTPSPAGGAVFKEEWFTLTDEDPEILATFITADTAETSKTHNDATVFSFWGIYKINRFGVESDDYALHWLDCWQIWVDPFELEKNFVTFYTDCLRYKQKPRFAAIEKKSTGTTLVSCLKNTQGIFAKEIERGRTSKSERFLNSQTYVSQGLISINRYAKHTKMCIEELSKITANDSHRRDDIADTMADAIQFALIDKAVNVMVKDKTNQPVLRNYQVNTSRITGWANS